MNGPRYALGFHPGPRWTPDNPLATLHPIDNVERFIVATPHRDGTPTRTPSIDFASQAQPFIVAQMRQAFAVGAAVRLHLETYDWRFVTDRVDDITDQQPGERPRVDVELGGEWIVASVGGPRYAVALQRDVRWWLETFPAFRLWAGRPS